MKYNKLCKTDLNISCISLGTWVFGGDSWGEVKEAECIDTINCALDYGINLIDTAPIYGYGQAETIIGKAIKNKRDKFIIATKCGLIGKGKNIKIDLSKESILKEVDESLNRLNIDSIDIYQCHWPDPNIEINETFATLIKLKENGKIKHIGVSNFDEKLLKAASDITNIVTLQNQYSLLERSLENKIAPILEEKNIGLISYGPLAGGVLSGKYTSVVQFKSFDARNFFYKFYKEDKLSKIQKMLDELKCINQPLNQVAINWVRKHEFSNSVIVGCRTPEQLKNNALAAGWELSDDEFLRINNILKNFKI